MAYEARCEFCRKVIPDGTDHYSITFTKEFFNTDLNKLQVKWARLMFCVCLNCGDEHDHYPLELMRHFVQKNM
jgi:hypothetical protein